MSTAKNATEPRKMTIRDELALASAGWRFVRREDSRSIWLRIDDGVAQVMEVPDV